MMQASIEKVAIATSASHRTAAGPAQQLAANTSIDQHAYVWFSASDQGSALYHSLKAKDDQLRS